MVASITNPLTLETITATERAAAAVSLGIGAAHDAVARAAHVTPSASGELAKAKEYLARCRNHYARARAFGASAEQLAGLAAAGKAAAEAIAKAEARAASTDTAEARRDRRARAMKMKGLNVREAVRLVAEDLVAAGLAVDVAAGVRSLAGVCDPRSATVEVILQAWLELRP